MHSNVLLTEHMKNRFLLTLLMITASLNFVKAQNQLTLEDIWTKGTFNAKGVAGFKSMNNGAYYTAQDAKENIIRYSFATGNAVDTLVYQRDLNLNGFSYEFSQDETKLLLQTNFKQIYRHSFSASIYVYDLTTKTVKQPIGDAVMLAEFSPDGKKLAYVKSNNLYVYDLAAGVEKQITTNGAVNQIINGATAWVYEEEFALSKGFYWNEQSTAIAFYTFDESQVREFNMIMYGKLYPDDYKFKYPKAGEKNSVITISVYQVSTQRITKVDIGTETDIYIPRINWTKAANQLCVQRLNRLQNKLELLLANAESGKSQVIYTEENKAYIDVPELTFLPDGKSFIINSEKSGWNHLYQYTLDGKLVKQITSGNWDVDQFYGYNAKSKQLFVSTSEVNSAERYVYAISLDGKTKKQLTARKGWNSATFNADFTYFLLSHSTINTPPYYALCNAAGKEVRVLEDNKALRDKMATYFLSSAEMS